MKLVKKMHDDNNENKWTINYLLIDFILKQLGIK